MLATTLERSFRSALPFTTAALTMLLLTGFSVASAQEAVITPSLQERLAEVGPDELIPVLISFDAGRTFSAQEQAAMEAMPKEERQTYVAREVVSFARQHQGSVLGILREAEQRGEAERVRSIEIASAASGRLTAEVIRAVATQPEVRRITWDRPLPPEQVLDGAGGASVAEGGLLEPTRTPPVEPEWGVAKVRAPELWAMGITGTSTLAAVLDNGCYYLHPDLVDHRWDGRATDGTQLWYDANSDGTQDPGESLTHHGWDTVNDDNNPIETGNPHGTQSAGIVLGDGSEQRQRATADGGGPGCHADVYSERRQRSSPDAGIRLSPRHARAVGELVQAARRDHDVGFR